MAVEQEVAQTAGEPGIPQLDFSAFPNQIFWLVLFLTAIYLVISRVANPRIGGIIEQRTLRVQKAIDDAKRSKGEAVRIEQEIEEKLTEARKQAEAIASKTRAEILEMQNIALEKVKTEIAAESLEAEARLNELRQSAGELVQNIAKSAALELVDHLMPGKNLDATINNAVNQRMNGHLT